VADRGADGLAIRQRAREAPAALADGKTVRPTIFTTVCVSSFMVKLDFLHTF
jgi:hypothetical protein